jgi:dienelactone hydrolase
MSLRSAFDDLRQGAGCALRVRFGLSLVVSCCLAGTALPAQVRQTAVAIKASDGVVLKATYFSPGSPGPAILLVHQCNMDRRAWDAFADALATAGFHVLTPDLRGFGESGRTPMPQKWGSDLDTAFDFLLAQPTVDKDRVAVGGASCGAVEASLLASRNRSVKALVLLSGGAGAGHGFIAATPSLPVFGAAAERDDAAAATRAAVEGSKNPHSDLRMSEGREHGVSMFRTNPDLVALIVQWLHDQLSTSGPTAR